MSCDQVRNVHLHIAERLELRRFCYELLAQAIHLNENFIIISNLQIVSLLSVELVYLNDLLCNSHFSVDCYPAVCILLFFLHNQIRAFLFYLVFS